MRTDPIIITGVGHSGTRGLVQVLQDVKNIYFGDIDNSFREWNFYIDLVEQVNCQLLKLPRHDLNLIPPEFYWSYQPTPEEIADSREFIIQKISENPTLSLPQDDTSIWVIKNPRMTVCLDIWYSVFPDAKIVNLVRDGRDVAASLPIWAGSLSRRFELWRARINRMWQYERLGIPITTFRYEDLVDAEKLNRFCNKLGIPYSDSTAVTQAKQKR